MKKLLSILSILLLLFSCEEDDSPNVLQGHIYLNCNNEPLSPRRLQVKGRNDEGFRGLQIYDIGEVDVNENGYYYLEYEAEKDFEGIRLYQNENSILKMPYKKNINAVHYQYPIVYHKFILKVDDPKTSSDTLYIGGASIDSSDIAIPGPFYDGQSFEAVTQPNIGLGTGNYFYDATADYGKANFFWKIGKLNYDTTFTKPSEQVYPYYIIGVPQVVCGRGGDVVIDLRGE